MISIHIQAESHWTLDYSLHIFFSKTQLPRVPAKKMIPVSRVGTAINLKHLFENVSILIPPSGVALIHPKQFVRYVSTLARKRVQAAKRELRSHII